jgi:hypothetical protein
MSPELANLFKLPTSCSERSCPGLCQAFKLGGCRHVLPSCTRSSRGVAVRPVSNLVSIGRLWLLLVGGTAGKSGDGSPYR